LSERNGGKLPEDEIMFRNRIFTEYYEKFLGHKDPVPANPDNPLAGPVHEGLMDFALVAMDMRADARAAIMGAVQRTGARVLRLRLDIEPIIEAALTQYRSTLPGDAAPPLATYDTFESKAGAGVESDVGQISGLQPATGLAIYGPGQQFVHDAGSPGLPPGRPINNGNPSL